MRVLVAILAIAVLAGTAVAQEAGGMGGRGGKRGGGSQQNSEQQKADQKKKQAIDDAYKSAIGRIPDPKEKHDPWKTMR